MDYKAIINLMKEMNHTQLTKLEIEQDGVRICMEKAVDIVKVSQDNCCAPVFSSPQVSMMPMQAPYITSQPMVGSIEPVANPVVDTAVENKSQPTEEAHNKKIVSPMVGTFYTSASPDKPAFVKVGDKVKKGQTVCIIEAMKLMNEIESEHDGEIVKILVNNEEMVEFGQPLFLIK